VYYVIPRLDGFEGLVVCAGVSACYAGQKGTAYQAVTYTD